MHVVHENDNTCRSINLKLKTVLLEDTNTVSFTDDEWHGNCQRQPPLMNEMLKGDIFICHFLYSVPFFIVTVQ